MDKKISYLNRTFDDYKKALISYSKEYYPDLATDFNDASVGSWLIDLNAEIADNLSYHIDRVFQETNIDSAAQKSSVYTLARNAGFKIPGPKGSMAEVTFSCNIPISNNVGLNGTREPDYRYYPIIKNGTKVSSGVQTFELLYDVDFSEQFNEHGVSDRTIVPLRDTNGFIIGYKVSKLAIVIAGETMIYRQTLTENDIKPFMEITIPTSNVMNIESIIVKPGTSFQSVPTYNEFYMSEETSSSSDNDSTRFFEVDYLAQQYRWGDKLIEDGDAPLKYEYSYLENGESHLSCAVTRGEWKPVMHKFITEFTDNGYLKVIFGPGVEPSVDCVDMSKMSDFARYQITRIVKNNALGYLPKPDSTIFIMYRVGGGLASNVAENTINTITSLNVEVGCSYNGINQGQKNSVKSSITVTNASPSVSGKDMPTVEELKYMIKYNSGAQERCVTIKDYIMRTLQMPARYGTPFRVGGAEDNNKIMLYLLGIDYNGKLDATLPAALVENIQDYLAEYRTINDFVEIKSGKIINVSFEITAYIDKNFNQSDVRAAIRNKVKEYMDINKHLMGDDIFIGDIEKEVSKLDGVINLTDISVYNEIGDGYSHTETTQEVYSYDECNSQDKENYQKNRLKINLEASDYILYSDGDSMLEIKYPDAADIKIYLKQK